MVGVDFEGASCDTGSKFGIMKVSAEIALVHEGIREEFRVYIK